MKNSICVLPLAALFLLASCATKSRETGDRPIHRTIRVACIGNSITYGSAIKDRELNNYPQVLGKILGAKYETRNFGVSGATLLKKGDKPYWDLPEFKEAAEYEPDIVVIKLGTNDSKPQNWSHGEDFASDLEAMIGRFQSLATRPQIFLCLPVPVYETKWGINEATIKKQIIPQIHRVADRKKLPIIDLYAALENHPEWFPDKIHPNAEGARQIAQTVASALITRPARLR